MSAIYYANNTFFEGERPDFTDTLRYSMPVNEGEARCHSISYKTIVTGVLNALRYFQYYRERRYDFESTAWQSLSYIAGMVYSVCCMRLPDDLLALYNTCQETHSHNDIDRFNQVLVNRAIADTQASFSGISTAFRALAETIVKQNQNDNIYYGSIAASADNLVAELNSCRANLRVGSEKWNSSIQDSFDMTNPASGKTAYTVILQPDDSVRISNLLQLTLGSHDEVPETQNALTFLSAQTFNGQAIKYSSDNRTVEFLRSGEIIECELSFYYYNYFADNALQTIPFV